MGGDGISTPVYEADAVEKATKEFILKQLLAAVKERRFLKFIEAILSTQGFRTKQSIEDPENPIDIIASKIGLENRTIKVQVKTPVTSSLDPDLSALLGKLGKNEDAMVISLVGFSPTARSYANSRSNLRLIDKDELVELVLSVYEKLSDEYKAMIPLRKLFVPETKGTPT
jgi:restriction system protein